MISRFFKKIYNHQIFQKVYNLPISREIHMFVALVLERALPGVIECLLVIRGDVVPVRASRIKILAAKLVNVLKVYNEIELPATLLKLRRELRIRMTSEAL